MIAIIIIGIILYIFFINLFSSKEEIFIIDEDSYTTTDLFNIADGLNPDWEIKSKKETKVKNKITLMTCIVINKITKKEVVIIIKKEMGINVKVINKN